MRWTVVKGSGRFEGATGSGTGSGVGDIPSATAYVDLRGMIAYNASSGAGK